MVSFGQRCSEHVQRRTAAIDLVLVSLLLTSTKFSKKFSMFLTVSLHFEHEFGNWEQFKFFY